MKNKIFFSIMLSIILFLTGQIVSAATTIEVEALTPFTTVNPSETMKVVIVEDVEFDNGIAWANGTIVTGQIIDVKQPTRGKRNASFKFLPLSSTFKGKTTTILDDDFVGKYSATKSLDKSQIVTSAATTAGGIIFNIPFFSQGVSLIKGVVKNPENNRIKSGVIQVYKDSPVSYIEEGKDVIINKDDVFYLKFKTKTSDDDEEFEETENNETTIEPKKNNELKEISNITTPPKTISIDSPEDVLREVEEALR